MYNNFTLHNTSVPEFTTSCRTHGGPATTVQWTVNGSRVQEDRYHETSQLILDTSLNSVYDNRLRVRGRRNGTYECSISNNIRHYLPYFVKEDEVKVSKTITVTGKLLHVVPLLSDIMPLCNSLIRSNAGRDSRDIT